MYLAVATCIVTACAEYIDLLAASTHYTIQVVVRAKRVELARSIATDKKKCLYVFCMEHFACSYS